MFSSFVDRLSNLDFRFAIVLFVGMLFPDDYIRTLRKVDAIDPKALSTTLKDVIDPRRKNARTSKLAEEYFHQTDIRNKISSSDSRELFRPPCDDCNANISTLQGENNDETLIVIDVNIDGVQIFKCSNMPQVIPILCRVYSIGKYIVPLQEAQPFLCGVYHGNGKPPVEVFIQDFRADLERLDPLKPKGYEGRKIQVVVRCFICDTPMRTMLKGVAGHNGYYGCERCVQKGEWQHGMYFPSIMKEPRLDSHWGLYIGKNPDDKCHRRTRSVFDNTCVGHRLVSAFVIDPMHTNDGGACPDAIRWSLRMTKGQPLRGKSVITVSCFLQICAV